MAWDNLASGYSSVGRFDDAVAIGERVAPQYEEVLGDHHPDTLIAWNNLASSYSCVSRHGEAIEIAERVIAKWDEVPSDRRSDAPRAWFIHAQSCRSVGRHDEAIASLKRAVDGFDGRPDIDSSQVAVMRQTLDHWREQEDWERPRAERPGKVPLSLAWFPADEWAKAVERWPHLTDELPAQHEPYTRHIESRVKWLARQQAARVLSISPLTVDELVESEGAQAGTGEGRSHLAAEVARTGRSLAWPPARNEPCWCSSGRKYKKCCGPVPPAQDDET